MSQHFAPASIADPVNPRSRQPRSGRAGSYSRVAASGNTQVAQSDSVKGER
ncbi:hypothetical protein MAHJHV57_33160 [Mycobacterium avium subsp. hominissuis]